MLIPDECASGERTRVRPLSSFICRVSAGEVVDLRIADELGFDQIAELVCTGHYIVVFAEHGGPERVPRPEQDSQAIDADRPSFSRQELRTMRLWFSGLTRAGVARRMGISEHTVKQYLDRAREKYAKAGRDARTRLDLFRQAQRDGIVDG